MGDEFEVVWTGSGYNSVKAQWVGYLFYGNGVEVTGADYCGFVPNFQIKLNFYVSH